MNILRYLTFEISHTCNLSHLHALCPISHPSRYLYGNKRYTLTDDIILKFWDWSTTLHGFRGIILWHMYNEPTHVLPRIRNLMRQMKMVDKFQPFQLTTNSGPNIEGFDILKDSDYDHAPNDGGLDNRIASAEGEGKPYSAMPPVGRCARGLGWEVPIDNHGNWCLCCNDWRCEESVGNIFVDDWEMLYTRWKEKARTIRWTDKNTYNRLPRMCRSCMDVNPNLRTSGGV